MAYESTQHVVLNEFSQDEKFYKLFAAENKIRYLSAKFMNCYYLVIFACCREIWLEDKHVNCVGAKSLEEAIKKIELLAE